MMQTESHHTSPLVSTVDKYKLVNDSPFNRHDFSLSHVYTFLFFHPSSLYQVPLALTGCWCSLTPMEGRKKRSRSITPQWLLYLSWLASALMLWVSRTQHHSGILDVIKSHWAWLSSDTLWVFIKKWEGNGARWKEKRGESWINY